MPYKYTSERETYVEDYHTAEVEIRELESGGDLKTTLTITFYPKKRVESMVEQMDRITDSATRDMANEYLERYREYNCRRYGILY